MRALIPAAVVVVAISACSAGNVQAGGTTAPTVSSSATADPGSTAAPTPSAGATDEATGGDVGPAPDDTRVAAIQVLAYGMELDNAEDQMVDFIAYSQSAVDSAARLQAVFGAAPVRSFTSDQDHVVTQYDFGGLALTQVNEQSLFLGRHYCVDVVAATVDGIPVSTVHGWHIGTPSAPIESTYSGERNNGSMVVEIQLTNDQYNRLRVYADDPYTTVTRFTLPEGG